MVTSIVCVEDMGETIWQCFSSVCVEKFRMAFQSVKKMFVGLVTAAILYYLQLISLHFLKPLPVWVLSLRFLISHASFACLDLIPVLSRHFKMRIWILYFFQLIFTSFLSTPFQFTAQKNQSLTLASPLFFLHVAVPPYSYLLALSSLLPSYHLSPNVCVPKSWFPELLFDSPVYLLYSKPLFLFGVLQASHLIYFFPLSPVISSFFPFFFLASQY